MKNHLKSILKQEDTVLFIGSGVSLWSGLPTWSGLIKELVDYVKSKGLDSKLVEQELARGELLQAASYGFDKMTKPQIAEFVRGASRLGIAKPHDIHQKIINLGPKCYVTTNYDKLLESSFQKWQPGSHYRTVINRQLVEIAEIVGARSSNFLFKLHGDAENSESIVLTREQYRALNTGGELHHALEAIKTLMVSRPFVYIGFGLRDLDFLYVKDLLQNTYMGGARDHYAIMANVSEQEKDYWRRNFGIHLIGYETILDATGKHDHSQLLNLLDELNSVEEIEVKPNPSINAEFILSLTRYASKYARLDNVKNHIPIIVDRVQEKRNVENDLSFYRYSGKEVGDLLDNGPSKLILIGLPGSGKSYALRQSVSRLGSILNKACLEDPFQFTSIIIPIFGDLKLYKGNIKNLLESTLPAGINLDFLLANFKVKIYLDAFNEMPREFIEGNHWDSDFADFKKNINNTSLIITSRTKDGLDGLEMPIFSLDSIERKFVESKIKKVGIKLKGIFKEDVFEILRRPFFYKLVFESNFKIDSETSPKKIYVDLLSLIYTKFKTRFRVKLNLELILSIVALEAIDSGEEAFKVQKLRNYLSEEIIQQNIQSLTPDDVINWLVSQEFLIPIVGERISFFHQSVTEFLAATNLAKTFELNPSILKEKLNFRHWDQALFLTLGSLDKARANQFLEAVIEIDFELALSAVRYMEGSTKEITERLLVEIENQAKSIDRLPYGISHCLEYKLPIEKFHAKTLRKIVNLGDSIGGVAMCRLLELFGKEFKKEAFELLVKNYKDFNFCNSVGRQLQKLITVSDLPKLKLMTDKIQKKVELAKMKEYDGIESGIGRLLIDIDPDKVYKTFYNKKLPENKQKVNIGVLCEFLTSNGTNDSLQIAAELLSFGITNVLSDIYFITSYSTEEDNLDYSVFTDKHINIIITELKNSSNENSSWALCALRNICQKRNEFIRLVEEKAKKTSGILKAALLYSITFNNDYSKTFEALGTLLNLSRIKLLKEPMPLVSHMDELSWNGNETLFVKLIKLQDLNLAYCLCDMIYEKESYYSDTTMDIGTIGWWLEWSMKANRTRTGDWFFSDRISSFLGRYTSKEKQLEFINELNNPQSKYRRILARTILAKFNNLTIDMLSEETISFLLEDLKKVDISAWNSGLIGRIATESFVTNRLLPLLKNAKGKFRKNLLIVIDVIGKRHGRRYTYTK